LDYCTGCSYRSGSPRRSPLSQNQVDVKSRRFHNCGA
jgi:hypothetical protein